MAEEEKKAEENSLKDFWSVAAAVGKLGVITVDATVGESLVRSYPSHSIENKNFYSVGKVELSCDTFRTGTSNHYVASKNACHVSFLFKSDNYKYKLEGPL